MNIEVREIKQPDAKYIIYVKVDKVNICAILVKDEIERDVNLKILNAII